MPSQTFNASGTWPCPLNYQPGSLVVTCIGEGGGGGTSVHGVHAGGGGGGGECAQDTPAVTAGNTYTITIGTGSTGTSTTFVGDSLTVTAHAGASSIGQTGGNGGSGSTNAVVFSGGNGASGGGVGASGGGGGGSAGNTGAGGAGNISGTGGTAGSGGGAVGGAGGSSLNTGSNGNAPGSGAGGGGSGGSINHAGGSGAAGQVILTWQIVIFTPSPQSRRYPVAIVRYPPQDRKPAPLVSIPLPVPPEPVRTPHFITAGLSHRVREPSPTGLPVPVQPPRLPAAERRWSKPPYPRKGVVPPTGLPVPVQPLEIPSTELRELAYRQPKIRRSKVALPVPILLIQPPERMQSVRRWSKPLFPRKGVVPPTMFAFQQPPAQYTPVYLRRLQRYQWYRRGIVAPTGWPIPVQPPMTSQWLRRWSKPLFPRKGVVPVDSLPPFPPVPAWRRARFKPPYPRKGNPQPQWGLPIPVQPVEVPHFVRARWKPPWPRRGIAWPESGAFPIPIQPPERMQLVRRWSKPLFPRRSIVRNYVLPGAAVLEGYLSLPLQIFTYIPGGPGLDLTSVNLSLFPLNRFGVTLQNPYGDVILVAYNTTGLPVQLTPIVLRMIELQPISLPPYNLAPGAMQAYGPFPYGDFTNPISGIMTVNVSANQSGVYFGAFRLIPAPPIGHTGQYDLLGARLRKLLRRDRENYSSAPGELHPGEATPGG